MLLAIKHEKFQREETHPTTNGTSSNLFFLAHHQRKRWRIFKFLFYEICLLLGAYVFGSFAGGVRHY
jgi:hypothetical protein